MPRIARTVFGGLPHHITQRGNRREDVFFTDEDRQFYLRYLEKYCQIHGVKVLAYCLMTNHVHLILVPEKEDSLQRVLKPLHMRYAQYINRQHEWSGHLWQGRFFSSPLDDAYLWFCVRYVERNPVRAGMVEFAENYPWSSAAAHCGLKLETLLTIENEHWNIFNGVEDWSDWLNNIESDEQLKVVRRNVQKNLPCGSELFIENLEKMAGNILRYRAVGRPMKEEKG